MLEISLIDKLHVREACGFRTVHFSYEGEWEIVDVKL